jgi:hypothetical protein
MVTAACTSCPPAKLARSGSRSSASSTSTVHVERSIHIDESDDLARKPRRPRSEPRPSRRKMGFERERGDLGVVVVSAFDQRVEMADQSLCRECRLRKPARVDLTRAHLQRQGIPVARCTVEKIMRMPRPSAPVRGTPSTMRLSL